MKTIEERAKELYPQNKPTMYTQFVAGIEQLAFKAGVEFAQRWISVEDELPEIGDEIIVKLKEHPLKKYQAWSIECRRDIEIIPVFATHWRPIELK